MNRREFISAFSGVPLGFGVGTASRNSSKKRVAAKISEASRGNVVSEPAQHTSMGVNLYSFSYRRPQSAHEFLEYCHSLGAGGIQAELGPSDDPKQLRRRAEELGMYIEIICELPRANAAGFEETIKSAKGAGAFCLRSACLSGRRYETFSSLADWKQFVAESRAALSRAVPLLERYRLPMGIENHKDWTAEEQVALLKEYSSEYLGACVDTGNNIALLDDPYEIVERLAPFAVCTHVKDMAVEEYSDGFLLAEVPLGRGFLDLKRITDTLARARPKTRFTLEMITRDPLKVPCLTERYWMTWPDRPCTYLARTLRMVRANRPDHALSRPGALEHEARLTLEEENVRRSLAYARNQLGLS